MIGQGILSANTSMMNDTNPENMQAATAEHHVLTNSSQILLHDQTDAAAFKGGAGTHADVSFASLPQSKVTHPSGMATRALNSRNSALPSSIGNNVSTNHAVTAQEQVDAAKKQKMIQNLQQTVEDQKRRGGLKTQQQQQQQMQQFKLAQG